MANKKRKKPAPKNAQLKIGLEIKWITAKRANEIVKFLEENGKGINERFDYEKIILKHNNRRRTFFVSTKSIDELTIILEPKSNA